MPKVSIVIPCYNCGKYVEETVRSIAEQPYCDYEIIIVDDGSDDNYTVSLLQNLSIGKILHKENGGPAKARNYGIEAATGEYILPLDADDLLAESSLVEPMKVLNENKSIAMCYGNINVFGSKNYTIKTSEYNSYKIRFANAFPVSSIFRKDAWKSVGGYSEDIEKLEDWDFWLKLVSKGYEFKKVNCTTLLYRTHVKQRSKKGLEKMNLVLKKFKERYPSLYTKKALKEARKKYNISWFESLIFKMPLRIRKFIGSTKFRKLSLLFNKIGMYKN